MYEIDDVVEMKKTHPCGNKEFVILRIGADFKLQCLKCQHIIMLTREKFEKSVKKIIRKGEKNVK